MAIAKTIEAYMAERSVPYALLPHPKTYSSRETAAAAHVYEDHIAKAVIMNNSDRYVMVVVPANGWVKLDAVRAELGADFAMTDEDVVERVFADCSPGAVPPLGPAYGLETLVDEALASLAHVYFEAGDHQQLVRVAGEDFKRLLGGSRHGHYGTGD